MAMIESIALVQGIGQFDSVSAPSNEKLPRLVLIHGENGRGKTTLAAILRSVASNDPTLITERSRIPSGKPMLVVLKSTESKSVVRFEGGKWTTTLAQLEV